MKRITSTLLIVALILAALPARADLGAQNLEPLQLKYSAKAENTACEEAVYLKLGAVAPCSGQLMPEDDAREYLKLKKLAPKYEKAWKGCENQLQTCIKQLKPECPKQNTPWYENKLVWGVGGFTIGLASGYGLYELIKTIMKRR